VRNSAYRSQVRNTKSLLSWKITRSVVLLSSSRATLGQRKSLINSITQISKHQFSGKPTQTHYNGKKNQHTKEAALRPEWSGRWVSFRAPFRTFGSDGRGCRSNGRLRRPGSANGSNAPRTFLSATATATATSLDCAPAGSPAAPTTTASARFRYRPTVPVPDLVSANRSSDTPAVASDGDLDVSRRTLAPGLVRRTDAAPCVLRATANRNRSSQLTAAAALTMRSSTSPNKVT